MNISVLILVALVALVWAVVWSITGTECLPGGNLFGIMFLYFFAVIGGKIFGLIKIRTLPPLPALLGKTPFLLFFLHSSVVWTSDICMLDTFGLGICKLQSPQICSFSKRLVSAPLGEGAERRRLAQVKWPGCYRASSLSSWLDQVWYCEVLWCQWNWKRLPPCCA